MKPKFITENNISPYDKIGAMMAKKMGVAQPFKQKDSVTNTIEQNRWEELDENQPDNTQSIDDYVKNPDKVMNNAKKRKVNEATDKAFKIQTLDSYQKASVHVPDHPLTSVKKKTKKVNEEESLSDQNALKDIKSKNKLTKLGIPFVYKSGPSGKKRVYLKMDVNDVIEQLKKLEWSEAGNNTENTLKKFHDKDGKMELAIYADGKDFPRVTLKPILENIKIDKLISNSLEPYIK